MNKPRDWFGFRFEFLPRYRKLPLAAVRTSCAAVAISFVLAGCGDEYTREVTSAAVADTTTGVSDGGSTGGDTVASGNTAPKIEGTPPAKSVAGTAFSFTPSASDDDYDPLTFTVSNLPYWADFDTSTGRISGAPTYNDVGEYTNIRITVFDGQTSVALPAFGIEVVGTATGAVTLSWLPPTEYVDGSPLDDLAGYVVYWGQSSDALEHSVTLDNPGLTSYMIEQLTPGTWYFTATAYDSDGIESSFANIVSKSIM